MVIVTLNPKVLYRGLFKGSLGLFVAKERKRKSIDRPSETQLPGGARAHREREREREKERGIRKRGAFCRRDIDAIKHFAR